MHTNSQVPKLPKYRKFKPRNLAGALRMRGISSASGMCIVVCASAVRFFFKYMMYHVHDINFQDFFYGALRVALYLWFFMSFMSLINETKQLFFHSFVNSILLVGVMQSCFCDSRLILQGLLYV